MHKEKLKYEDENGNLIKPKYDKQKKLDIIMNIPGFNEFVLEALYNAKLKVSDFKYLNDVEIFDGDDIYIKRISK